MIAGTSRFPSERDVEYSRIFAGAAWPAVHRGFVAIVGEHKVQRVLGKPTVVLLDETDDDRLWHVVERLAALTAYYHPESVLVDAQHVAAMQFVEEFRGGGLRPDHSFLCTLDHPWSYALPVLGQMTATQRLVVPAGSRLAGELLTVPRHEDPGKLRLSDFPAVAALAFAVLGLEQTRAASLRRPPTQIDAGGRILR